MSKEARGSESKRDKNDTNKADQFRAAFLEDDVKDSKDSPKSDSGSSSDSSGKSGDASASESGTKSEGAGKSEGAAKSEGAGKSEGSAKSSSEQKSAGTKDSQSASKSGNESTDAQKPADNEQGQPSAKPGESGKAGAPTNEQKSETSPKPEASANSENSKGSEGTAKSEEPKSSGGTDKSGEAAKSGQSPTPKSSDIKAMTEDFQSHLRQFAADNPGSFDQIMTQAFDQSNPADLKALGDQVRNGEIPMPKSVEYATDEVLKGAQAAYNSENGGSILLSDTLRNNPDAARSALAEEMGHHFDSQLGKGDSSGDEGAIFAKGLETGEALPKEEAAKLKAESDQGTIERNGKLESVENKGEQRPPEKLSAGDYRQYVRNLTSTNADEANSAARRLAIDGLQHGNMGALGDLTSGYATATPETQAQMMDDMLTIRKHADATGNQELRDATTKFLQEVTRAPDQQMQQLRQLGGEIRPGTQVVQTDRQGRPVETEGTDIGEFREMAGEAFGKYGSIYDVAKYSRENLGTDEQRKVFDHSPLQGGEAINDYTQRGMNLLSGMPESMSRADQAMKVLKDSVKPGEEGAHRDFLRNSLSGGYKRFDAQQQLVNQMDTMSVDEIRKTMNAKGGYGFKKEALSTEGPTRERLVEAAGKPGNEALRKELTEEFSKQGVSDDSFSRFNDQVSKEVGDRIQDALKKPADQREGIENVYAEYGKLLKAKEMYLGKQDGWDKVDYGQVRKEMGIREGQLQDDVLGIQRELGESNAGRQEEYLKSQDFHDRMRLTPSEERGDLVRSELQKLNATNPEAAKKLEENLSQQLGLVQAQEPSIGLELFNSKTPAEQAEVLQGLTKDQAKLAMGEFGGTAKTVSSLQNVLDGDAAGAAAKVLSGIDPKKVKNTGDLARQFSGGLDAARLTLRRAIDAGGEGVEDARSALKKLDRVSEWARKMSDSGGWGALGGSLGIASLMMGSTPETTKEKIGLATSVAGTVEHLGDVTKVGAGLTGKLFGVSNKVDDLAKLRAVKGMGNFFKTVGKFGPGLDLVGGAMDVHTAYTEAAKGDVHDTQAAAVSAAGGLGAGLGGVALTAGLVSNPVGWGIIGVGAAVGVAGLAYDYFGGMSDNEEFLHQNGWHNEY